MALKGILAALLCTLAWNSASTADEHRPDEFLTLDVPQALLSPEPLGPPTRFQPVAVEAKADRATQRAVRAAPVRAAKRHVGVRTKPVRRRTNPLDEQAFDARIQGWPCRSGGICNWRQGQPP